MAERRPPRKRRPPVGPGMGSGPSPKPLPKARRRRTKIKKPSGKRGGFGRRNIRQTIPRLRVMAGGNMQLYGSMIDCWRNGNTIAGCSDGVDGSTNGGYCCKNKASKHLSAL